MQQAIFQQAPVTQFQTQASRVLPGHGTGMENHNEEKEAANDKFCQDESSLLRQFLSILANVIGGTILLSGMFILPHVIARILG